MTQIVGYVPRSITVTQSELKGKTTIEAALESPQAGIYKSLAKKIAEHSESKVPSPLEIGDLRKWAEKWAEKILKIESESIQPTGAHI